MSSKIRYGKNSILDIYAGYGNNALAYICNNDNNFGEYRHLQFLKPTTGDLNTWLQSNAVKMPLEGTWVFNSTLTGLVAGGNWDITFTSNGNSYSKFIRSSDSISYGSTMVYTTPYKDSPWSDAAYRTITFTQTVKYEGNEEFVRWFVDNATPPLNN